ncbi:unnamed protein product [Cylindrotheca closterium]|uniref:Uncharacterized protein n=1 Tax=Cylindrotheca closterium TaxID=2856 RepID=A0AAD2G1E5_9STRA|nr:unnamed protein product [Cylindrotheca closterium]
MNEIRSENEIVESVESTKIDLGLKTFFQQLAKDKNVKGFCLVPDNARCPRYNLKRNSAPSVINGATRTILSYDEAPNCPLRRVSEGCPLLRRVSDGDHDSHVSLLETIFNEVDNIIHEVDESDEENDAQSICLKDSSNRNRAMHKDVDFDCSFQRFSMDPSGDESRESSSRSSSSLREQLVAPRLPIRKGSIDSFVCSETANAESCDSFSATSTTADCSLDEAQSSWQRKEDECLAPAPIIRYTIDLKANFVSPLQGMESKLSKQRRQRSSRRNSLDTGFTFRTSFTSRRIDEASDNEDEDRPSRLVNL